ncbi:MAG: exodeoxyribonuclease VII large subunit [Gammaproteobacteria bacterium]|nr:exodeoxyribonuclease VII large subunit [Gammaproteobacteria bacterium]
MRAIADTLAARFNPVTVRGEISGFSRAASGHCYFSLKDDTGQVRCALFRRSADQLDFAPRDGQVVEALGKLKPIVRADGTVTAGNASGVNDGAAAIIVASKAAVEKYGLTPRARVLGGAVAGVPPRIMGIGPAPASQKLLERLGLAIGAIDVVELNEAFASQGLAVLRQLGLPDDAAHVNPNGGAIALGHPLGMSGARLVLSATEELVRSGGSKALCTMCIGVGQGIALALERV